MCCDGPVCVKAGICERFSDRLLKSLYEKPDRIGCLVTGAARIGKTTLVTRIMDDRVLQRFVTPLHLDQWTPVHRICRVAPSPALEAVKMAISSLVKVGRVPLVEGAIPPDYAPKVANTLGLTLISLPDVEGELQLRRFMNEAIQIRFDLLFANPLCAAVRTDYE